MSSSSYKVSSPKIYCSCLQGNNYCLYSVVTYDKQAWDAAANARAMVADAGTVATDAMDVLDRC